MMLRYVEICWDMLRYVDMFRSPDIDAINMPSTGSMGGFQDLRPPASSHPWCQTLTRTRQRSLKLLIETCCPYFCLHGLVWFSHFQHGSNGSHCPSVCYCVFFGSYSLHQENEEAVVKGGRSFYWNILKYFEVYTVYQDISRYIKIYQDISRYIKIYQVHQVHQTFLSFEGANWAIGQCLFHWKSWSVSWPVRQYIWYRMYVNSMLSMPMHCMPLRSTTQCHCRPFCCSEIDTKCQRYAATRYARNLLNKKTPARQATLGCGYLPDTSRVMWMAVDTNWCHRHADQASPPCSSLVLAQDARSSLPRKTLFERNSVDTNETWRDYIDTMNRYI